MTKFWKFSIISISITGIYLILLYILTDIIGLWYMWSVVILSATLAITSFAINYLWTWHSKHTEPKTIIISRFVKYAVVGGGVTLLTWSLLYALTEFVHLWYMTSAIIAWIIAVVVTFLANNYWTYSKEKANV